MLADIALGPAALVGLFSLLLCGRTLLAPGTAATGFGVPAVQGLEPYMAIKASRDLAIVLMILVLVAAAPAHTLGWVMLAAAVIPIVDGIIVQRNGGPKSVAVGVHHVTAVLMLTTAALLLAS